MYLAAGAAAFVGISVLAGGTQSQTARTIRIVVPFAPGGAASVVARLLADQIGATQRVTVVVENRPGGGSVIATEAVAGSTPDGNTLLINGTALLQNPLLRKHNYDPLNSFDPICKLTDQPSVLAVNSDSPYRNLNDFIAAARAKPSQLTIATFGLNLALEDFKRKANVNITLVPYAGSGPAVTALLGGHISAMVDNFATMGEHVNAGNLRALATFAPKRVDGLAHIPTFAESGYNVQKSWWGLFASARTPRQTASELVAWTAAAMQRPEVRQKLAPLGLYPSNMCGTQFSEFLHRQYEDFGRIIREANIKAE
jgi:tripartite-type tricarboxylate transporter receptor subunit TctC